MTTQMAPKSQKIFLESIATSPAGAWLVDRSPER